MGEDTYTYTHSPSTYSHSIPVKLEEREQAVVGMVPYHLNNSDPYCGDQKIMGNITDKSFHPDMLDDYDDNKPQLHHMASLSTTCTSDSLHSSLPSGDSGEVSVFDLNATEAQEYEWSPNRIIPPSLLLADYVD